MACLLMGGEGVLDNYFIVASNSNPPIWSSAVCVDKELLKQIGGFPVGITSGRRLTYMGSNRFIYRFCFLLKRLQQHLILVMRVLLLQDEKMIEVISLVMNCKKLYLSHKNIKGLKSYLSLWYKMKAMNSLQLNDRLDLLYFSFKSLKYNMFAYKVYVYIVMAFLPHTINRFLLNRLQG